MAALAGVALDAARQVERLETQRERLEEENKALKGRLADEIAGQRIVAPRRRCAGCWTSSSGWRRAASTSWCAGESGTGKELIAKLLHLLSRREGALIAVNCAALPESLLESELFGIEGGVATGVQARPGKFELADRGTLLPRRDRRHADLPPGASCCAPSRSGRWCGVGGRRPIPVDVRLVAATHQDLEALVGEGRFREDLYYRLKGVEVELPPLRERRRTSPTWCAPSSRSSAAGRGSRCRILRSEALALLLAHDFPGNVRELQNVVEGAVSLAEGEIDAELVALAARMPPRPPPPSRSTSPPWSGGISPASSSSPAATRARRRKILGLDRKTLQRKGF